MINILQHGNLIGQPEPEDFSVFFSSSFCRLFKLPTWKMMITLFIFFCICVFFSYTRRFCDCGWKKRKYAAEIVTYFPHMQFFGWIYASHTRQSKFCIMRWFFSIWMESLYVVFHGCCGELFPNLQQLLWQFHQLCKFTVHKIIKKQNQGR